MGGLLGKILGGVGTILGGPLGGAVAGAVGGMFDNRMARKNREGDEARLRAATGYDFVRLRDQAEAAGFNPLTVLQSTGGAGYDGRGAVLATPFTPFARETLGNMSDSFRRNFEADRGYALEARRVAALEREVSAFSPIAAQYSGGGSPFARGPVTSVAGSRAMSPSALAWGVVIPALDRLTPGTELYSNGKLVAGDYYTSDAQDWETRSGQIGGESAGVGNLGRDFWARLKAEWNATPLMSGGVRGPAVPRGPAKDWTEDFGF